jgi:hypothetical protein
MAVGAIAIFVLFKKSFLVIAKGYFWHSVKEAANAHR